MYLYPRDIDEELIGAVASASKVLPYLDIPLQHINDEVLRRMHRPVRRTETEQLIERLRAGIERLVLRTTLMVGFPGETDRQFDELIRFVEESRFERLGVFAYRLEPGTVSAELDGQLPESVKQDRRNRLLAAQQRVAFAWSESQVGRAVDVLIDGRIAGERRAYVGRSWADAPDVDSVVYVTGKNLAPGQIVPCEIVATRGYDLIGVAVARPR
jgi:ribosomal protein S12 methylthiotransferase